jgi:DNA-binding NtrC family response regulator
MPKILIVDNEVKFCKVIKASLDLEDLPVDYCISGKDTLHYLKKNSVDIVVTDLRMDGMDGLQLLEQVKAHYPHIEVIIMTAYASQKTAVDALKKGAYDYLIKPFEMDELTLRIRRILDQQQILEENKRLRQSREEPVFFHKIIGRSKKMQDIYRLIKKGSENDAAGKAAPGKN